MPERPMLFLCDDRVQRLSAQAECFLHRVCEVFAHYPMALDEHGCAPADPAQLRNLTYPHKPDIRHTHVERWFAEIESASLVTVRESGLGRWFTLAHAGAVRQEKVEAGRLKDETRHSLSLASMPTPNAPREVIHNPAGLSPPKLDQINAAAAAASSLDLLLGNLQPHFPLLDLEAEYRAYYADRRGKKKPAVAVHENPRLLTFVKWLLQAAVPLPAPPPRAPRVESATPAPVIITPLDQTQPDLFEEAAARRFHARLAERKLRGERTNC